MLKSIDEIWVRISVKSNTDSGPNRTLIRWKPNTNDEAVGGTKQAGHPGVRFHDLRHLHSSVLGASGAAIEDIGTRLGHSQASFTRNTHAHSLESSAKHTPDLFDQAVEKATKKAQSPTAA